MKISPFDPDEDLKSIFSEQSSCVDPDDTIFTMIISDTEESLESEKSNDSISTHYHESFRAFPCLSSQTFPVPHVEMKILKSKYDIPTKVIGFIDTNAAQTMVNPNIFPGI